MLEEVVSARVAARLRSRSGNMFGVSLDAFGLRLRTRGYATATICSYLFVAADFGRWLRRKRVRLGAITEEIAQRFLKEYCNRPSRRSRASGLRRFLEVLRERGIVEPSFAGTPTDESRLLDAYAGYLRENRGLKDATILWHVAYLRGFLRHAKAAGAQDLRHLTADHVRGFIALRAERYTPGTVKNVAKALRSFLRFLHVQRGLRVATLIAAVPSIREWKLAGLPKYLSDDQVRRVLASFNVSAPQGLRDRAIAVCLVDLGLRSIEVAQLSLDAIDWRAGTIRLQAGKAARSSELPLPQSVGRALVAYLRQGRPKTRTRRIFVRHRAPVGDPLLPCSIGAAMKRAFRRAGISATSNGAHALRHTAATRLLRAGASLKEIADILRHRSIDTTAIYAKVDLVRLQEVALPWPVKRV